jgi:hypothetical protein
MATQALSQATLNEAHTLALSGHTWPRGRSKVNGQQFYLIPSSSVPNTAHRVTNFGCTCTGHRRRGDCKHVEAVRIFEAASAGDEPSRPDKPQTDEQSPLSKYRDVMGFCAEGSCDEYRVKGERFCARHALVDAF